MVLYDLFVAGAETTSNTLEFAMLYMVLHPEVQTKVQEEIDRVVGKSRRVTLEDKSKYAYSNDSISYSHGMQNHYFGFWTECHTRKQRF